MVGEELSSDPVTSQYIRSIFQDSKGNLWFDTLGEGVVRYDASTDAVKTLTYFSNPEGFINNTVYAINEDKTGNLWFGTDQGVYKYDSGLSRHISGDEVGQGKPFGKSNQKDGLSHIDLSRKAFLLTNRVLFGSARMAAFSDMTHMPLAQVV